MASRMVADVAADVVAIMNHLGVERFAVLGRSGSGLRRLDLQVTALQAPFA
jgi:pimeloyl-ACP methyl ester carboxylesterase